MAKMSRERVKIHRRAHRPPYGIGCDACKRRRAHRARWGKQYGRYLY